MNKALSFFISFLLALMVCGLNAQSKLQKEADKLFGKFAFSKAVPLYEELVQEGTNNNHAYMRLAECNLLMRDYEKALPYFEEFIEDPNTPSTYYYKYAMALQSVGDTDGSEEWLKKYEKENKNDPRVKRLFEDGSLATVVFNSNERYELTPVDFNTKYSEFGAYVFAGQLYFSSNRPQKRSSSKEVYDWDGKPWLDIFQVPEGVDNAEPKKISGDINSKYHESSIVFSTDHKKDTVAYFTRNSYFDDKEGLYTKKTKDKEESYSNLKIYKAEEEEGKWKTAREMKMNADHYSTGHPTVNTERTLMAFASDKPGGYGGTDIYFADIHERGGVLNIRNAGPIINTGGNELFPYINNEGQLFFSSDGHPGFGMLDVFGTVADEEGKYIDIINLGKPLNSPQDDFGYFAMDNGVDGYVSSNRKGGEGSDDIYSFEFVPALTLYGQVTDAINLQALEGVEIKLFDAKTKELIEKATSDEEGNYKMLIDRKKDYIIEAVSKTHPKKKLRFSTHKVGRAHKKVKKDIVLEPTMDVRLLAGLNKIYFDFDKSYIRPDAALELDKVVKLMLVTYPEMVIHLESHTDPLGSNAYNNNLSQARAKSTYEYLISNGVPKSRILSYKGYGKTRPVNDCTSLNDCTEEELELNRRTEFPIVKFSDKRPVKSVSSIE